MIVIFTTTYRSLYHRDLLNIVCFPSGERIRLGYKRLDIDENLLDRAKLTGEAVIVFADYENIDGTRRYKFYPVRTVRIIENNIEDPGIQEDISLNIELHSSHFNYKDFSTTDLIDFQIWASSIASRPREPSDTNPRSFVTQVSDWRFNTLFTDNGWTNTAKYMSKIESLSKSTFYRLNSDRPDYNSSYHITQFRKFRRKPIAEDNIIAGLSYELNIDIVPSKEGNLKLPIVDCSQASVVHGPYIQQGAGGNIGLQYWLNIPSDLSGKILSSRIGPAKQITDEPEIREMMPELYNTSYVRMSWPQRVKLSLCILFLVLGNLISTGIIPNSNADVQIIGSVIFAIGVFLLFGVRRMALPTS